MKKALTLLFAVVVAVGLFFLLPDRAKAVTYSGSCGDNVNWSLNTETGVLSITGVGDMMNYFCKYNSSLNSNFTTAPWGNYVSSVKNVTIGNGVTSIGEYAFYGCTCLTSFTIPDSVTSIREQAFCNCTGLTSFSVPGSVESIGQLVFSYCTGLTSVALSVTNVEWGAFYGCRNLISVTIENGMTSIGESVFSGCSSLTSICIPDSVTNIGSSAFYGCTSLQTVYYLGMPEQINAISIGAHNDPLLNANYRYLPANYDELRVAGRTLVFDSTFSARYLLKKTVFDAAQAAGTTVQSFTVAVNGEARDVSSVIGSDQVVTIDGVDYYWVKVAGIAAKDIETEFTFSLVCVYEGETFSDTYTDSVAAALTQVTEDAPGTAFANAANATLAYCKAAADAFGKANAITFAAVPDATDYAALQNNYDGEGTIEFCGTSILLKDELAIKFWAKKGSYTRPIQLLTVKINGEAVEAEIAENGDYVTFKIPVSIDAAKTAMTIELFRNTTSVSNRYTDSVLNYALSLTGENAPLGQAIVNYVHYANAYLALFTPYDPSEDELPHISHT